MQDGPVVPDSGAAFLSQLPDSLARPATWMAASARRTKVSCRSRRRRRSSSALVCEIFSDKVVKSLRARRHRQLVLAVQAKDGERQDDAPQSRKYESAVRRLVAEDVAREAEQGGPDLDGDGALHALEVRLEEVERRLCSPAHV